MRVLIFILLVMACGAAAFAQEKPIVRAEVKPGTVIVGESAELTITVLVPTWFTRPSVYPTFELANAMTRLPADNSYPVRERVGNESWSGIVRTYEVYPLIGATYRMAGQTVSVTFANPGSDPITTDIEVPEVVLRGIVPEGAESLDPYISGQDFELTLDVDGELDNLVVGDAVVLEYAARLDGLPAIFLPPLAPDLQLDGVSVYADAPDLADGASARRSEKLTLVFDAGGEFAIPGVELEYWNTESRSIETAVAAGFSISVDGPPAAMTVSDATVESRWPRIIGLGAALAGLVYVFWRLSPVAARRYRHAVDQRKQSEPYAFSQLSRAFSSSDPETAYRALLSWLERLQPGIGTRRFATRYGDESLGEAVEALSESVYAGKQSDVDLRTIRKMLAAARGRYFSQRSTRQTLSLPPLNP